MLLTCSLSSKALSIRVSKKVCMNVVATGTQLSVILNCQSAQERSFGLGQLAVLHSQVSFGSQYGPKPIPGKQFAHNHIFGDWDGLVLLPLCQRTVPGTSSWSQWLTQLCSPLIFMRLLALVKPFCWALSQQLYMSCRHQGVGLCLDSTSHKIAFNVLQVSYWFWQASSIKSI